MIVHGFATCLTLQTRPLKFAGRFNSFLEAGAQVTARNKRGSTPLSLAKDEYHLGVVHLQEAHGRLSR